MKIKYLKAGAMLFVAPFCALSVAAQTSASQGQTEREYYVQTISRIADPVLTAISKNELKKNMPVEAKEPKDIKDRMYSTHLEAFGRLLAGMAP